VKHADAADLQSAAQLLARLRALPGIIEKKPGIFYRKSAAFLHFHADGTNLYADLKIVGEFVRFEVNTPAQQTKLIDAATKAATA
jgi:hypothetical protein